MQLYFASPQQGLSDVSYRPSPESAMKKAGVPHSQLGSGVSLHWAQQAGMSTNVPLSQLDFGSFPHSVGFSNSIVVSQLRFGHSFGSSHSSAKTSTRQLPYIVTCEQVNPKHEQQVLCTPNSINGRLELPHSPSGHKYLVVEQHNYANPSSTSSHTPPKSRNPRLKHSHSFEEEAWDLLRAAVVNYCGNPVGTIAANDPSESNTLNYDQVFIRDFIPSAMAFLLNGEHEIVRNFLLHTLQLQSWEKTVDCYDPGQGLMPASFKVRVIPAEENGANGTEEVLDPDFGESAIGRVAPVDSGLWWIILLRAYGLSTGDFSFQERVDVQTGIRMILKLCLTDEFDMFPTLLVTDGSCMIDRRMGIHGHPLEIQSLFYSALLCGREILQREDSGSDLIREIDLRLLALSFHIREYYWVDLRRLNEIYRYKTEEYSFDAINKFNIYPDQISPWLVDWMPDQGGYLIGNLQPAHMDFRFFSLGNLWAIVSSLATQEQAAAILDLVEARWDDIIGNMPFKICFPALEGEDWSIITGRDPKNTPWSYHNGGSWPTLLWQFTAACIKMGRPELAQRAVEVAEKKISKDRWPEYYDTRTARFIGKQARLYQTWSIAGYLVSKMLLKNPAGANMVICDDNPPLNFCSLEANPRRKRGRKPSTAPIIV